MARRPIPFRIRIALAGLAGLGLAWLIPKGGETPAPIPTPTASDVPGVTAAQIPLDDVPEGISFHVFDRVRVFLVRAEGSIIGLLGRSTAPGVAPVYWCPRNGWFEGEDGTVYDMNTGGVARWSAPRSLERVRVLVAGPTVTVFPQDVQPGTTAVPATPTPRPTFIRPEPCSASERLG